MLATGDAYWPFDKCSSKVADQGPSFAVGSQPAAVWIPPSYPVFFSPPWSRRGWPSPSDGRVRGEIHNILLVAPERQDAFCQTSSWQETLGVGWGVGTLSPLPLPGRGAIRPSRVNSISVSRGASTCSVSSGSEMCVA